MVARVLLSLLDLYMLLLLRLPDEVRQNNGVPA